MDRRLAHQVSSNTRGGMVLPRLARHLGAVGGLYGLHARAGAAMLTSLIEGSGPWVAPSASGGPAARQFKLSESIKSTRVVAAQHSTRTCGDRARKFTQHGEDNAEASSYRNLHRCACGRGNQHHRSNACLRGGRVRRYRGVLQTRQLPGSLHVRPRFRGRVCPRIRDGLHWRGGTLLRHLQQHRFSCALRSIN